MSEGPPRDDEAELIRRARAGEPEAFGFLVDRHLARAVRAALALVGAPEPALDLTQDALLRVFEARGRLDPARPFYPFLYQALRRRCFNWLRDERGRAGRLALQGAFVARAPSPDDDPARRAELADEHRRVVGAIETLPPREREVLVLEDIDDEPFGWSRVLQALERHGRLGAEAVVAALQAEVRAWTAGRPQDDDLVLVALRRLEG